MPIEQQDWGGVTSVTTRRLTVAGLPLRWREFRAIRSDRRRADGDVVSFGLWAIEDPDALVDRPAHEAAGTAGADLGQVSRDANPDQGMPYFGVVWPAAESLVAKILTGPRLDGRRVLDLGCGLGACGFAAARLGAELTFFDREPRALAIVAATAREPEWRAAVLTLVVGDWRTPPPLGSFDLIVGADLLYDREDGPAVAPFLACHLRPGAEAWLADPGRVNAERFPAAAQDAGLEIMRAVRLPTREGQPDVRLLRLRRPLTS